MTQRISPRRRALRGIACLVLASASLTACGSGSGNGTGGDGVSFTWTAAAVGPMDALYKEALRRVNEEYGYDGKWVEVEESEVAVSGVAANKFQLSHGVTATAMAAQQAQDANLVFVGDFLKNFWTVSGRTDIESCNDLNGVKFGLNSPGGVSTALFNAWQAEKCDPGVKPDIQYIDGSDNRVQGLLAGQLDASMIDMEGTTRFDDTVHIVADMASEVPGIETNNIFVNRSFAEENSEVVTHILEAMIDVTTEIVGEPTKLAALITQSYPDFSDDADKIAELYDQNQLVDPTGGTQIADMERTLALYQSVDAVGPGLEISRSVDRSYLDAALRETGK